MKVTLNDIALALGVSTATVSRALNNQGRIGQGTRDLVVAKAIEMGYELPNRNICADKMVGIVFDRRLQSLATDPFYSTVMMGVEKGCLEHHSQVFFQTVDQESDKRLAVLSEQDRLHGLIVVGGDMQREFIDKLKLIGIPFVLVDNLSEGVDCIVSDNAGGVEKSLTHLFSLGHERIGFVGGPLTHSSLLERYETYRRLLQEQGITPQKKWSYLHSELGPSVEKGYEAIRIWAQEGLAVTAIVADNDSTAVGILRGCAELGVRVPQDLSIVGFDNISLSEHITPGITSVDVNKEKMGEWAAKRLHELMEKEDEPVRIVIGTKLIVRGSTGVAPEELSLRAN
jgi:DNA-binding LacI/PurR family transcriptional regulator